MKYLFKVIGGSVMKILITCLACFQFYAETEAQNAPVTTIASIRNPVPGQMITIPVTVTGFVNIGSISLSIDFDNTMMNFVSAEINPVISAVRMPEVGDNDMGKGMHRLILGWFGGSVTLPDSSWVVKYVFTYISGTPSLSWFDNGPSTAYTDPSGYFLNDTPSVDYYSDGNICNEMAAPSLISGPVTIDEGTTNVVYSISPIQNILGYSWSVPSGAIITGGSGSNSITVDYPSDAKSGNIVVSGVDLCGQGPPSKLAVTLVEIPVGIDPVQDPGNTEADFLIYPNPANSCFTLKSKGSPDKPELLTILSTSGQSLKTINIRNGSAENEYLVEVPDLPTGIYLVLIKTELRYVLKKLIIK
ncbi:MAG: T9SS type A sorting domain-containing protein [Bacteroidales bacterium]